VTNRLLRLALAAAALLVLAQSPFPAVANHGGRSIGSLFTCDRPVYPPRCTSVADNLIHIVAFDASLTDGLASSLRDTMAEDYDPTDLRMIETREVTSATDVTVFSEDYGDIGAAGWVYCPSDAPQGTNSEGDRWCRQQELRLNLNPRYSVFFADDASRDHVTCHELGHTIGLRHWGNPPESRGPAAATCMNANTPNGPTQLHQFDIDHINAYFYVAPPPSRRVRFLDPPAERERVTTPLGTTGVQAMEVEHFASLPDITRAADAVIRGRVVSVLPGRAFGDLSGSPLHYAAATLRVEELVAGRLPAADAVELTLEIPLFDGPASIGALEAALPGAEGLFFLRNKGASARDAGMPPADQLADSRYYRLVVFGAVVDNAAGVARAAPGESTALSSLDGIGFEEAVARTRLYGR
jgi:hypothetical protein